MDFARTGVEYGTDYIHWMTRPHHGCEGPFPGGAVGLAGREGADPAPLREPEGGFQRALADAVPRLGGVVFLDPGGLEGLPDPAVAEAPPLERGGPCRGEGGVVDIAEGRYARDESLDVGVSGACPAPLANLAREIGSEPGPGRGISLHIEKSGPFQSRFIERLPGLFVSFSVHAP